MGASCRPIDRCHHRGAPPLCSRAMGADETSAPTEPAAALAAVRPQDDLKALLIYLGPALMMLKLRTAGDGGASRPLDPTTIGLWGLAALGVGLAAIGTSLSLSP